MRIFLLGLFVLAGCNEASNPDTSDEQERDGGPAIAANSASVDYGNDSSEFANDGECDDPRFAGSNMSPVLLMDSVGTDASDCKTAVEAGEADISPLFVTPATDADILWGDDLGEYSNDGECDDPRFEGSGMAEEPYLAEDIGTDASDCKTAFDAKTITWKGLRLP